ncbi:MAG: alanine racemase [Chlorobiaceae bacterium]
MDDTDPTLMAEGTPGEHLSEARISLGHLVSNVGAIRKRIGSSPRIMGIVKANAYGHDAKRVAAALEATGIHDFGVANIQEAIELKTSGALKSPARILAFAPPLPSHIEQFLQHGIDMTLCDMSTLEAAEARAATAGKPLGVQLKVDTGMGRLGAKPGDAMGLLSRVDSSPHLELTAIYTHFAESSIPGGFTQMQLETFKTLTSEYEHLAGKTLCKHAANSGAILSEPDSWLDMVRPGILLYGYHPSEQTPLRLDLKPVMQMEAKVIFIKKVDTGTTISYSRRWSAPEPRYIATISAGYADGYSRTLSGRATVTINGTAYPQIGTVTMDQIMVDLGKELKAAQGDTAILFGWDGLTAEELAGIAGTISYETLCAVSSRVKRIFV